MKSAFQRFNRKVTTESILKTLGLAFAIGFTVTFVVALVCWLTGYSHSVVLSLCLGLAAAASAAPLLYFRKFRPTAMKIAAKVDAMGLEERLITMTELENDTSYIAMRQRQDALEKLAYVNERSMKMNISRRAVAALSVAAVFGVSMTTVAGLASAGLMPGLPDIIDPVNAETYIAVDYEVEGDGVIEGEANQLILSGDKTEIVIAVPEDGWAFVGWDDGYEDPVRFDENVTEDKLFVAIFKELSSGGDGDPNGEPGEGGEGEGEGEGEGDPSQDGDSSQNGDPDSPPDASDRDEEGGDQGSDGDSSDENSDNRPGSGQYVDNNKIIDNNTYYGDVLDQYKGDAMDYIDNDDSLSEEDKEMIKNYFGTI